MMVPSVRATYQDGGWVVVVVAVAANGGGGHAAVFSVALDLQAEPAGLWAAIVAAARAIGFPLPRLPDAPPSSPAAGVREWRLAARG